MPILPDYHAFGGYYWETASVRNALDYGGVLAPHTQQPFSEAFLMGVSGGIVVGYFSFAYEGHEPHVALLTRNTFDPLDTIFTRLAIPQDVHQTHNPTTAVKNLVNALENGDAPLVWADAFSLPYNSLPFMDDMWMMMPIVVYGYDDKQNVVHIADRSQVGLTVTTQDLDKARGRVKKDKYRLMVLHSVDTAKVVSAVQKGIFDCLRLFTEDPPKGSKHNFGFLALKRWADLLVKPKEKNSWAEVFPRGSALYGGLRTAFEGIETFGKSGTAERDLYAQFLEEASLVLNKPTLNDVATLFREAGKGWTALADALLPQRVTVFDEARTLLRQHRELFATQGNASTDQRLAIRRRLNEIKAAMESDFPLNEAEVDDLMQDLRAHILRIYDLEWQAVSALQNAMA